MLTYTHATIKGQVVIPVTLRRKFGITAGTRIYIYEENGRIVLKPITRDSIRKLRGSLKGKKAMKALMADRAWERDH